MTRRAPWIVVPILMCPLLLGAGYARLRAVVECDLGINAGMASLGPAAKGFLLFLTTLIIGEALRRAIPVIPLVPTLLTIGFVSAWIFLTWTTPPVGYPDSVPTCLGNVPAWWPTSWP